MRMFKIKGHDGKTLNMISGWDDAVMLRIPGTNVFLDPHTTVHELFKAAGYKTFDTALPQPWVDQWNRERNTEQYVVPRGVWCYDEGFGIFGQFVSMEDALKKIGELMTCEVTS